MERSLQSALEKRTRVGSWQTRVYRLERGYLSAWSDVVSAAAHEEPTRTDCLFHGTQQPLLLTEPPDKRFRLDFPWDGAKTLQLRSNNPAMKEAWVNLLRATLEEIESQIRSTGSVFAYGGTAQHAQDEAYEEAAYLKTNRFLAAYVVDEQSRASYANDLLNEGFDHMGDRAGGGGDARRACAGANSAITELIALSADFKEEMQGLDDLRRGKQTDASASSQLDPTVAAPKIQRFCEEYMSLVGRTIASRLMLELSPFMDTSVAGSSAAPTESTRAELVATRRRLDEAYATTDRLVVLGTRAWFMDIRDNFLDCAGLENASSTPPTPPPEVATQTAGFELPVAVPLAEAAEERGQATPPDGTGRRPSTKALLQVSSAFSAARAATIDGATKMSSGLSVKGRSSGKAATTFGAAGSSEKAVDPPGQGGGMVSAMKGVSVSLPSVFRRGSRTASDKAQPPDPGGLSAYEQEARQPSSSPKSTFARGGSVSESGRAGPGVTSTEQPPSAAHAGDVVGAGGKAVKSPENEERERSDLFGGSSRSPSRSPRANSSAAARGRQEIGDRGGSFSAFGSAPKAENDAVRGASISGSTAASTGASSLTAASGSGARKEKRAFAGGLWGGGGDGEGAGTPAGRSTSASAAVPSRAGGAKDREAIATPSREEAGEEQSSLSFSEPAPEVEKDSSPSVANDGSNSAPTGASTLTPPTASRPGARKEKRAFAGGLWGGGAKSEGARTPAGPIMDPDPMREPAPSTGFAAAVETANEPATQTPVEVGAKPKPSGGKRRFAGGVFGGPPAPPSSAATQAPAESSRIDNPFAGGAGAGAGDSGARDRGAGRSGTARSSFVAASQSKPVAEPSVPAWAASSGAEESVPDWAAEGDPPSGSGRRDASNSASSGGGASQRSNGFGLAPPSRPEQGEEEAAGKSPFMRVEAQAPAARRPSQRRPGESGSRRAFGGGERLF
ncbi:unnamed protein product [Scytosiphon promiscuus]